MSTPEQRSDEERRAARRSAAARYAVNTSWAYTPDRRKRTQPGTKASPVSYEYWERRLREEGRVREEDVPAAARNAHTAYMQKLAQKSAATRAAKKAAKAKARAGAQ